MSALLARWRFGRLFLVCVGLGALLSVAGCGTDSTKPAATAARSKKPVELLAQMADAYRRANSYEDVGELRLLVDGAPEDEFRSLPLQVTFERPNKVRIHALDTIVVADGEQLHAVVQSLAGQVLVRECPANLQLADLEGDEMLVQAMRGQLDVRLPQLLLLCDSQSLKKLMQDNTPTQLPDVEFHGQLCHRVALKGPDGTAVYWIDAQTHVLRKLELPLDEIRKKFPLAALWAEFKGARLDSKIDSVAFKMELPEGGQLVKHFVLPPPAEPAKLLNQVPADFTFVDMTGEPVSRESLLGKVVVLDMWATWCGWCFEGLPQLEQVYQQFKQNGNVTILAVCKDEPTVSDETVRAAFDKHKLTIPIVRDSAQASDQLFQLEGLPTMVVLGPDGSIQDYHVGFDARLAENLPAKLEKLLAGENLAQNELEAYEREKRDYEQRLSEALVESDQAEGPASETAQQGQPAGTLK